MNTDYYKTVRHHDMVTSTKESRHTDNDSGDCSALDKNSDMLPRRRLLICKQRDCRGVRRSSGNWYSAKQSYTHLG